MTVHPASFNVVALAWEKHTQGLRFFFCEHPALRIVETGVGGRAMGRPALRVALPEEPTTTGAWFCGCPGVDPQRLATISKGMHLFNARTGPLHCP